VGVWYQGVGALRNIWGRKDAPPAIYREVRRGGMGSSKVKLEGPGLSVVPLCNPALRFLCLPIWYGRDV